MKKQITYALLASLLLASLAGCGDNETTPKETKSESTTTEVVTEALSPSGLPQDLTFGGQELRFVLCNGDLFTLKEAGEVVNDANYRRKTEIEELLDMKVVNIENGMEIYSSSDMLRQVVMSGTDDFDIVGAQQWILTQEVPNHLYLNLAESDYIDFDKPWWYKNYIDEMTIGDDVVYFAVGDVSMQVVRYMGCMYVNKSLYANYFDSVDALMNEILAGKWTLDRLSERVTEAYSDLSGDGRKNRNDQFGIGLVSSSFTDHFTYDAGVRATERDEHDIPYLVLNNERTASFTEKLHDLYYENVGSMMYTADAKNIDQVIPEKFGKGEMLFMPGFFYTAENMRNADLNFTIIPYPKYDEEQESYHSLVHDGAHVSAVVSTSNRLDLAAAFYQEAAYRGSLELLPAYYETALKIKYTHDDSELQPKLIDLIHDNATTDFAYVYNYALDNIAIIERFIMYSSSGNFASTYASMSKSAEKKLDDLIELMLEES